jgi:uncharacterized membrane protein YeaQ/YmgE (transglycosylase-associated protein family)
MDMSFVWFLLIGLCAGWLAGQILKGGGFGLVGDMVVGVIGALLGGWLFGILGVFPGGGLIGALITATVGAIVLLLLLRLVKRGGAV